MVKEKANFTFEPSAISRTDSTYYDGYWQHEEYFSDIRGDLLKTFAFTPFDDAQNLQIAQIASMHDSCSIHIRRGDYLTDPLRKGTTGSDYITSAIKKIQSFVSIKAWLVFSDDITWCRQNLCNILEQEHTYYIDWNKGERSIHDMHLMSLCHHHIIANSSFSWWGAWLSKRQDGVTIAPAIWMNMKDVCSPVPDKWIKI